MSSHVAVELRWGTKIAHFIANHIWLILIASTLGHLGAWHWGLDLFAHFRWQYLLASALCLCAAIWARKARLIWLGALGLLWNFALIAQYPLSSSKIALSAATPLKVLFANGAMATRGDELIALIQAESPDIIGVAELSTALSDRLGVEFSASYSVQALAPDTGWQGIGVLVKNAALDDVHADVLDDTEFEFPTARLQWPGGELLVVHPIPPVSAGAAASRDAYFAALAQYAARQPDSQTLIVTGDFNATVWSLPYRKMLSAGGFVDSTLGFWPKPTWHGPNALFAPLSVPIDQLLMRGPVVASNRRIVTNSGSDHSALVCRVAFRRD
jgi:endonuclease/exonuclease/phosphatase (EEP) superfamily protein YafD